MPAGAQAAYPMASASNPPVQQMQQMQVAAPRSAPRAAAKAPSSKAVLDDEATLRGKTYGQIVFGHLGRVDAEKKLKEACVAGGKERARHACVCVSHPPPSTLEQQTMWVLFFLSFFLSSISIL